MTQLGEGIAALAIISRLESAAASAREGTPL